MPAGGRAPRRATEVPYAYSQWITAPTPDGHRDDGQPSRPIADTCCL